MDKIIYTLADGSVAIVCPAPKVNLEKQFGSLTDVQYEELVRARSIPEDAINVRGIRDSDIPVSRKYREAWIDVTSESRIDVCCEKARNIALERLRRDRDNKLSDNDALYIRIIKDNGDPTDVLAKRNALLSATDDLKMLDVTGKVNDENLLDQIEELSKLRVGTDDIKNS